MPTVHDGTPVSGPRLVRFLQLERDYLNAKDKLAIGSRLRETREQSGFTEQQMADMLDPPVTDRTIRNYETGKGRSLTYLRQWAAITESTYDYLLRGERAAEAQADLDAVRDRLEEVAEMVARGFELLGVPPGELRQPADGRFRKAAGRPRRR